jgi:hypothetical protein
MAASTLGEHVLTGKLRDAERVIVGLEAVIERMRSNETSLLATVQELQDVVTFLSTGRSAHARTA